MDYRKEHDYLGELNVPVDAYWGAQTQRAIQNFPISGLKPHPEYVRATVLVKRAAAQANLEAGLLKDKVAKAIMDAADEVLSGKLAEQFVVDVYQAGAGTSHNMNVNEVLANRAEELLGGKRGEHRLVHPNDHVNMSQSTNDVIPTAIRLSGLALWMRLDESLVTLISSLRKKSKEFDNIVKSGRTHLMDAAPIRLGQEFEAWARMIERSRDRISYAADKLKELNIGATAVGTGLNADPEYVRRVVEILSSLTGFNLRAAGYLPEVTQSTDDFLNLSAALRTLASDLIKISNDLRLMYSGPVTGLSEIVLPPVQPGSSIMPGKVNPSIPEMVDMVGFQVVGNDTSILMASQAGQLELNVMMPLIAHLQCQNLTILANACRVLAEKCISGIVPNREKMESLVAKTPGVALALNPYIGYEKAAEVVKKAVAEGKTIKECVLEMKLLPEDVVNSIFDPHELTEPGIAGRGKRGKH
ncbi:MAG: aspartate ammonia-lyase [Thermoprotei archaeon]